MHLFSFIVTHSLFAVEDMISAKIRSRSVYNSHDFFRTYENTFKIHGWNFSDLL